MAMEKIKIYDSSGKITRKTVIFSDHMVITLDNPREKNNMPGEKSEIEYKHTSPYCWLVDTSSSWDRGKLRRALLTLALQLTFNDLQNVLENEMDDDRYFDRIE